MDLLINIWLLLGVVAAAIIIIFGLIIDDMPEPLALLVFGWIGISVVALLCFVGYHSISNIVHISGGSHG